MFINSEVRRQAFVVKRRGASKDAPATVGMPVAGRDERPRSSAWARGLAGVVGKWRMAEATHSGRGPDGRNDTIGHGRKRRLTGTVRPTLVGCTEAAASAVARYYLVGCCG